MTISGLSEVTCERHAWRALGDQSFVDKALARHRAEYHGESVVDDFEPLLEWDGPVRELTVWHYKAAS